MTFERIFRFSFTCNVLTFTEDISTFSCNKYHLTYTESYVVQHNITQYHTKIIICIVISPALSEAFVS
jgi:hypothetical protein